MTRAALLAFTLCACVHRAPATADVPVVFIARTIHTLNPEAPVAQALVMQRHVLTFVGTEQEALDFAGPQAVVERWPASTIVPGLIDAHGHLASLGASLSHVNLEGTHSEAEVVARVAKAGPDAFEGEWLIARGWDQNDWPDTHWPTHASLDALPLRAPMFLSRIDGHAAWLNAEALKRAGITKNTPDPLGGHIERTSTGEPTGVLIDNAIDLVKLPVPDVKTAQRHLKKALEHCARLGLTQIHDAGMSLRDFEILQSWDLQNVLPIRVYAMADGQGDEADTFLERGVFSGRHLELRGVKLLADGALGSRGAALKQPYRDDPKNRGLLLLSDADFRSRVKRFADRGFQVAVHAIGDRAIAWVLDALETLPDDARARVEHTQILDAEDLPRFARHHLIASYQPTHATSDMPWAVDRVGEARLTLAYAWRSMLDSGARIALGSDFPVESANPLLGLYAARTRQDARGEPRDGWYPVQRLTAQEALRGFTADNAYASFAETHRGQLRAGFDADFVVLPIDPVTDEASALLTAPIELTVVDGVDVYRAPP